MSDPQDNAVRRVFDEQAAFWSGQYDNGGVMAPRIQLFLDAVEGRVSTGGRILDFGCGSGDITSALAGKNYDVVGCDLSGRMIDKARENSADGASFVHLDGDVLAEVVGCDFDGVVASSVLEYVSDPQACLARLWSVVRPGGWLFFTVPDMRHSTRRRERWYRLAVSLPGAGPVIGVTRYRAFAQYLKVSVNRMQRARWEAILVAAGWNAEPVPPVGGSLVLLSAQKPVP